MRSFSTAILKQSPSANPQCRIAINGQRVFISKGIDLETEILGCKGLRQKVKLDGKKRTCIQSLLLNESQNFLAIVRHRTIDIAYLGGLTSNAQDIDKELVVLELVNDNSDENIISALWHPASSTERHLVVLTDTKVAIYDYTISSSPQFELRFENFSDLDGQKVVSMAFGSTKNFAGSTSLYLSTDQGSVFVFTPFMYNGFPQRFTTRMITEYLNESDACFDYLQRVMPPSSIFIPLMASVLNYDAYRSALRNLFSSLKMEGYDDSKEWAFKATHLANPQLVGPLFQTQTECKLLNVAPHEPTSMLACMHFSEKGKLIISYISQIRTLIYGCEFGSIHFEKPTAPEPKENTVDSQKYVRPRRGFGFQVVESNNEAAKQALIREMEKYKLDIADYHTLNSTLMKISKHFNLLTGERIDMFDISCSSIKDVCWESSNSWLFFKQQGNLYVSDMLNARAEGFFKPLYAFKRMEVDAVGFLDDCHCPELTLLTYGPDLTEVTFGQKKITEKPTTNLSYKLETRATKNGSNTVLPADELKSYLTEPFEPSALKPVDIDSSESLRDIFDASAVAVHKTKTMTLFILALQSTLAIQHGELKLQQQGLKEIPEAGSFRIGKKTEARISKILEHQNKLIERANALQTLITKRFEDSKKKFNLPLSKSEKAWFKELNSVTTQIGTDTAESLSLQLIVRNLTEKVSSLQKREPTEVDNLAKDLETLRMDKTWQRLIFILKHEQKKLNETKLHVDHLLVKFDDLNLGVPV